MDRSSFGHACLGGFSFSTTTAQRHTNSCHILTTSQTTPNTVAENPFPHSKYPKQKPTDNQLTRCIRVLVLPPRGYRPPLVHIHYKTHLPRPAYHLTQNPSPTRLRTRQLQNPQNPRNLSPSPNPNQIHFSSTAKHRTQRSLPLFHKRSRFFTLPSIPVLLLPSNNHQFPQKPSGEILPQLCALRKNVTETPHTIAIS